MNIYSKGFNAIQNLEEILLDYKNINILVVTGKKSFVSSGSKEAIDNLLNNYKYTVFSDFEINPKIKDVKKGLRIAKKNKTNLIIAIGGGSVLDMAKLIKGCFNAVASVENIIKGFSKIKDPRIPLIAIPTTAGSGSESTHFAVAYIGNNKYSVADQCLLPEKVILDGALSLSATKYQKACNVLDALAQAIESMWAVNSTSQSKKNSIKAISMCIECIPEYVSNSQNYEIAQKMLEASNLAGQAINISKTTAPHAWSYGISINHGVPHGHAVWLTLPKIFEIHAEYSIKNSSLQELKEIMSKLKSLFNISSNDMILDYFYSFLSSIDIKHDLVNDFKLSKNQRLNLSNSVNQERLLNNPVNFNKEHINSIFNLD